jgi:hypothetical protein
MIGNVVFADERENLLAGPIEQRIDSDHAMPGRDDGKRGTDTLIRLIGSQTSDPCDSIREGAPERFDLAHGAASVARLNRSVESVDTLTPHQGFYGAAVRTRCKNPPTIAVLGLHPDRKRFWEQPAGIEGHHVDREALAEDRMGDGLVLDGKARREDNPTGDDAADRSDALIEMEAEARVR